MNVKPFLLFGALTLTLAAAGQADQPQSRPSRWDLVMIQEGPIWKRLLIERTVADQAKVWPQRKRACIEILQQYPKSRWADDAELLLAGGKASIEKDIDGAIADLKAVAERYPDADTVVTGWDLQTSCLFDQVWESASHSLVFLDAGGTVRMNKPFDRNGPAVPQEYKEFIAYFDHLAEHPRRTPVVAKLMMASMTSSKGDTAGTIAIYQQIVEASRKYLATERAADLKARNKPDGYHIRQWWRPEYTAYTNLMGYCEKQNDITRAAAIAAELANVVSKEGSLWTLNRMIGAFYNRQGLKAEATQQYRLALDGLKEEIEFTKRRNKLWAADASFVGDPDLVAPEMARELAELETLARRD